VKVVLTTTPADLERLYRFRYEVYVEQLGWLPANDERLLYDEFDEFSYNYAAIESGEVVGSIRIVPDNPAGLPFERCSPMNGYREGRRVVELCRLAVAPEHRGTLGGLLMKAGYQRALLIDATHIALDAYIGEGSQSELYAKMGYEPISEPFHDPDWLCEMPEQVFAIDLVRASSEWPTERPGLNRFFTSVDEKIDHQAEGADPA
jgi:putrescine aminotransferase